MALHILTMKFYIRKQDNTHHEDSPNVIKDLNLSVTKGELVGICGQVGHGKTSFFNALLGELRCTTSRERLETHISKQQNKLHASYNDVPVEVEAADPRFDAQIPHIYLNGKVAYFNQQPHIFSRSARENIIFGKEYIEQKYQTIVKLCCLEDDFKLFAAGDMTEIGGKGVTLSGGQKARVSLARALYSDADIYLLDDPLSAVDAHVGKTIWSQAIMGYLKQRGATVLIASHQTQYFKDADKIL